MAKLKRLKFLDENGHEIPDQERPAIPAGFKVPETLEQQIARLTRRELSKQADEQGFETFEESEDFDIDDDMFDPQSPYEEVFDPVLGRGITVDEWKRNEAVYRDRYLKADQAAWDAMDRSDALRARRRAEVAGDPASRFGEQSGREATPKDSGPSKDPKDGS